MLESITLHNLTDSDIEKVRQLFHAFETKRTATWSFPLGDSKVTLTIEGPVECKESEVLQYAIDVLEVAKKNAIC